MGREKCLPSETLLICSGDGLSPMAPTDRMDRTDPSGRLGHNLWHACNMVNRDTPIMCHYDTRLPVIVDSPQRTQGKA